MPPEDASPLTTERIHISRRRPLVVAAVAISIVGVLVWKPWAPPASNPVAAVPTDAHITPQPLPTASASPTHALPATPAPEPTPDQVPGSTLEVGTIIDTGFVVFQCDFAGDGSDGSLSAIALGPPEIHLFRGDSRVRSLSWHAEIEANRIDKVFEADWQTIVESPPQFRRVANLDSVRFDTTRIAWDQPADELLVLRPTFVIEWHDRERAVIGSARIAPRIFGPDPEGFAVDDGCTIT
jgi:hypothetical protein